jgi:hypothetical protein
MKTLSPEDMQNKLHRVVEIYAPNPLDPNAGTLGSGFAVTDDLVLTAKHVVQDAKQVRVRGLGEEWPTYRSAEVVWLSAKWDAALIRLADAPWSSVPDRGELHWVRLSGQFPILWIAYGFPRATEFPSGPGRELEAIDGDIIPGAGFKRGTLSLNVKSALPLPTAESSSLWQGISGAAILTEQDRKLIGLIVHDPPGFETSRLQGIPVEHLVSDPEFAQLVGVQTTEPVGVQSKREIHALEKQERKKRRALLMRVKARLTEEIRASLYHKILEEYKLSQVPAEVVHPWHFIYQPLPHAAYELPANTSITEIYDRTQGTLLLTGEGGAGKTTLLQMLALDLLQRAEQEETEPIPFVVSLEAWTKKDQDFSQWLVEALEKKPYRLSSLVSQRLIKKDLVLPLLDGVNQIAPSELAVCVRAIDSYQKEHSLLPLVLCSRDTDALEQHGGHLLDVIVTIQPLQPEQIDAYLQIIDRASTRIHDIFQRDPPLYELAKTPLRLCLLLFIARHGAGFDPAISVSTRRQQIFSRYTEYMLNRTDVAQRYPPQKIKQWLRFLARYLTNNRETEFYIEDLTVESLFPATIQQTVVGIAADSIVILPIGWGLYRLVDNTLRAYAHGYTGIGSYLDVFHYLPSIPFSSLLFLILFFLDIAALVFFCYPLYAFWPRYNRPMGIVHFWEVWPRLTKEHKFFAIFGALGLVPILWVGSGPIPAFASALISFATLNLTHPIPKKLTLTRPNQGVWYSLLQGIGYGLVSGILFGSVMGIAVWSGTTLSWGLTIGFFTAWVVFWLVGLAYGGKLVLRHSYLRFVAVSRVLPLNLSRFLHHAESRLLLRRIGGGYSFYHPLFLEYFAASSTATQPPSAGTPSPKRTGTRSSVPASRRRRKRKTHI